jgi:hypothetical protein
MKLSYLPLLALAFAGIGTESALAQDTPKELPFCHIITLDWR